MYPFIRLSLNSEIPVITPLLVHTSSHPHIITRSAARTLHFCQQSLGSIYTLNVRNVLKRVMRDYFYKTVTCLIFLVLDL
jgi:hypothetical protein